MSNEPPSFAIANRVDHAGVILSFLRPGPDTPSLNEGQWPTLADFDVQTPLDVPVSKFHNKAYNNSRFPCQV